MADASTYRMVVQMDLDATKVTNKMGQVEKNLRGQQKAMTQIKSEMERALSPVQKWSKIQKELNSYLSQTEKQLKDAKAQAEELASKASDPKAQKALEKANAQVEKLTATYKKLNDYQSFANRQVAKLSAKDILQKGNEVLKVIIKIAQIIDKIVSSISNVASKTAEIRENAAGVGMSSEAYQRAVGANKAFGVSEETTRSALSKVDEIINNLASGNGLSDAQNLARLGIDYRQVAGSTDREKVLSEILNGIRQSGDSNTQRYYASQIFGSDVGSKLIPLLSVSGDELTRIGNTVSVKTDAEIDEAQKLLETQEKLKEQMDEMVAKLIPTATRFMEDLLSLVSKISPNVEKILDDWTGFLNKFPFKLFDSIYDALHPKESSRAAEERLENGNYSWDQQGMQQWASDDLNKQARDRTKAFFQGIGEWFKKLWHGQLFGTSNVANTTNNNVAVYTTANNVSVADIDSVLGSQAMIS